MKKKNIIPQDKKSIKFYLFCLTNILIFIISISAGFYTAYNVNQPGYSGIYILPAVYGVIFIVFISPILFFRNNIFVSVFTIVSFTRYVLLPFLIVYTGFYDGRSSVPPVDSSFNMAIKLMLYELITVSIALFFIFKNLKTESIKAVKVKLPDNNFIYIAFLFMSLLLALITPSVFNSFYLISPPDELFKFNSGSTLSSITFYCLVISKYFLFLMIITFFYKRYLITNNKFYIFLSFLLTLLNISIVFGANRADFIVTAIVSLVLFNILYPKQSRLAIVVITLFIILITNSINEHRDHASYTGGEDKIKDITNTIQIYLGGPYNVAIAIEAARNNPQARDISHFGFDMLRPTLGPNVLLKNLEMKMSSDYFNERIYFSNHKAQIIPIIGQGYFFFGFVFSPIIMIGFLIFVRYLLKVLYNQKRIELLFFLLIPVTRIGLAMGQNGSILMNDISFFLILSMLMYYINNKIRL